MEDLTGPPVKRACRPTNRRSLLLHSVVFLHAILRHPVVLLHAVLGHRIFLHGILRHRVLFHAVVLAHFVLGKRAWRECKPKRNDGGGHAERDTGADGHWSVFPLKTVLKATD